MLLAIAWFELRQQLRSHVFWIVVAISALMVAGAVWIPDLRVGLGEAVSGPGFTIRTHLVWTLFYLFTAAAFAADAILRDDQTGFAPIVGATPVPRRTHILGRLIGAYAATAICYLSVPLTLHLAAGADPATNLYALFVLGLPNLLTATALFLALATWTRSLLGALLGAVALLALYGLGENGAGQTLLEPFGFAAYEAQTGVLPNRLLWMAISLGVLALLLVLPPRPLQRKGAARSAVAGPEPQASHLAPTLATPKHGPATARAQFTARTRLELAQILFTPVFAILLLLGLGHAAAILWRMPAGAVPDANLLALVEAFQLTPVVVALFFAGELYWSERDRRVHDLIAAAPVPNAALFLPKLLALALALLALALASAAAALLVPTLKGAAAPALDRLLLAYVLPKWFDWALIGVLAMFLQALSPNKLAGWGLMILYLIASLALERTGYTDPLYRYAEYPSYPVPEPLADEPLSPYRIYWAAMAVLLTVLATRLTGRAGHDPLPVRLRRLGRPGN